MTRNAPVKMHDSTGGYSETSNIRDDVLSDVGI